MFGGTDKNEPNRLEIFDFTPLNFNRVLEIVYFREIKDTAFFTYDYFESKKAHKWLANSEWPLMNQIWKDTAEIVEIAERWNFASVVKAYLKSLMIYNVLKCENNGRDYCLNIHMFGLFHKLESSKYKKDFPKSFDQKWLEYVGNEQLSEDLLDFATHFISKLPEDKK